MTWLAPAFLLALPLLSVPIVLHFWRKRRRKTLPWGAMEFLINDDHRQRKLSNLDRWLVLAARCLILMCLIAALARPLLHSRQYGSLDSKTDDILILDQSLSTSRSDEQGDAVFERMRERAKEWVRSRPRSSSVRILTTAGRPAWLTNMPDASAAAQQRVLQKELDALRPIAAQSNLSAAVRFAATTQFDLEEGESSPLRRIWVLSDGQSADWKLESKEMLDGFCAELGQLTEVELNIGLVETTSRKSNVSLAPLSSDGWRKAPGERIRLSTEVTNHGRTGSQPGTVVWTVGKSEIGRTPIVSLRPGESMLLEANHVVRQSGTHVVRCQIEIDDLLTGDNESVGVLETLDRVPVLVISDRESHPDRLSEADFFLAALGQQPRESSPRESLWRSVFHATTTSSDKLKEHTLGDYDSVVLLDVGVLPRDTMQTLQDYVARGGGLWLFLGDHTDVQTFNRDWYAEGLGCAPVKLAALEVLDSDGTESRPANQQEHPDSRLHPPEREHPTLQWLSDSTQTDLNEVLIRRFYSIHHADSHSQIRVLLRTSGGSPVSLLASLGRGRVVVQTLPMNRSWTNWPLTGSFVVMVDSWLRHLTEPRRATHNLTPGAPLRLRLPLADSHPETEIEMPDGTTTQALTVAVQEMRELRYSQTLEAGLYHVRWQEPDRSSRRRSETIELDDSQPNVIEHERHFAVSLPVDESRLAKMPQTMKNRMSRIRHLTFYDVASDGNAWTQATPLQPQNKEERSQRIPKLPIWTPLLYGLLAFLLVELMLSSFASLRRFGRLRARSSDDVSYEPSLAQPSLDAPPSLDAAPPSPAEALTS